MAPNEQVNRRAVTDACHVETTNRRVRLNEWLGCAGVMSSIEPLVAAPRKGAPGQATHRADEGSPEERAQEEISVEDSKQSHEQSEYEHETAPPEHTAHKEKVDKATTAKDLPYAMHVLAPVPRESRGRHMRALTIKLTGAPPPTHAK